MNTINERMRKDEGFQKWCFDTELVGNKNWFNLENGSGDEVYIAFEAWEHQQAIIESHEQRRIELAKENQRLHKEVAAYKSQIRDAINAFDSLHSESLKDDVRDIVKPFISDDLCE